MTDIIPSKPYEPKTKKEKIIYYGATFLIMIILFAILIPTASDIFYNPDYVQLIEPPLINLIPVTILIIVIVTLIYILSSRGVKTK